VFKAGAIEDQVGIAVYCSRPNARRLIRPAPSSRAPDGGNDVFDALVYAFVRHPFPGSQCVEMLLESA